MNMSAMAQLADRLISSDNPVSQDSTKSRGHHHHVRRGHDGSNQGDHYTPSSAASAASGPAGTTVSASLQYEQLNFSAVDVTAATSSGSTRSAPVVPAAASSPGVAFSSLNATDSSANLLVRINSQLAALGLSSSEIQAFDQYARLIQQFNPAAFKALANQLSALAAQFSSPAATGSSAPGSATYQLSELSVSFTGLNESASSTSQKSGGVSTTEQVSAFQLQIQEVRASLTDSSGQTVQLQSPEAATTSANATPGPSVAG